MDYLVLTVPDGGQVAIPMDVDWIIWSSKTGNTTFLGTSFLAVDVIEVDASFLDVMDWFDHYVEPGNTSTVSDKKGTHKTSHHKKIIRLVETTN